MSDHNSGETTMDCAVSINFTILVDGNPERPVEAVREYLRLLGRDELLDLLLEDAAVAVWDYQYPVGIGATIRAVEGGE